MRKADDYLEWDLEYADAGKARAADGVRLENLYDREIRIRIGEIIARAVQQTNERREP
jgi:hypothetical protein